MKEKYLEFRAICQDVRVEMSSLGMQTLDKDDGSPLPLTDLVAIYQEARPGQKHTPKIRQALITRNMLLLQNMGLVGRVAHRYSNKFLAHEDLEQAGVFGLIRALDEYDPARASFSTFAIIWIRAAVQKALQAAGKLDVGGASREDRLAAKTYARTGKMPSAKEMGVAPSKLEHERQKKVNVSMEETRGALGSGWRCRGVGAGDELSVGDLLTYEDQQNAEQMLLREEAIQVAAMSLDRVLNPVEEIIVRRAVLGEENLRDTARFLDMPIGSVWKAKDRAIEKLRGALKEHLR